MTTKDRAPLIICDNCNRQAEQVLVRRGGCNHYEKPGGWGSCHVGPDKNGSPKVMFHDLCPICTDAATAAAASALNTEAASGFDGPTAAD